MSLYTFEKSLIENTKDASNSDIPAVQDEMLLFKQKIEKRKEKQERQKKLKVILLGLITAVLLLALLLGYSQYRLYTLAHEETLIPVASSTSTSFEKTSAASSSSITAEEIIKVLGRHILLPAGNPQIAEVQDVTKLKESQLFFKDAENGDVVIIYETMIYIYRPSRDIIVAVGDISGVGQTKP